MIYPKTKKINGKKPRLSVVIPFKARVWSEDLKSRLKFIQVSDYSDYNCEIVVVDDGSSEEVLRELCAICAVCRYKLIETRTKDSAFSIGRSRNYAAQTLETEYIFFLDVDLIPNPRLFELLFSEIELLEESSSIYDFIMCPVIYLDQNATDNFLNEPSQSAFNKIVTRWLRGAHENIEKYSFGTSACVYRREAFLSLGGNSPKFRNWGFEDLDFNCRLIRRLGRYPLARDWTKDVGTFAEISTYRGWKSTYSLFGLESSYKGLILLHAWHPVDKESEYIRMAKQNKGIFSWRLMQDSASQLKEDSLPDLTQGRSLLLKSNPFTLNEKVKVFYGEIVEVSPERRRIDQIRKLIDELEISRVIFHNPYVDPETIDIYRFVRRNNIPYVVCERGALEGSHFYDSKGFNADSESYHPEKWARQLTPFQLDQICSFIESYKSRAGTLEEQTENTKKISLRDRYNLTKKKLLFVPLQRPGDTVIKYFCGKIKSYDNFIEAVQDFVNRCQKEWHVLVKEHPLEDKKPDLKGVIWVSDSHIHDILEQADAVYTINSGVGFLSLLWDVRTIVAGNAFYLHDGVCQEAMNANQLFEAVNTPSLEDKHRRLQFLYHVIFHVYSFSDFVVEPRVLPDGSRITATTHIDVKRLSIFGEQYNFSSEEKVANFNKSVLSSKFSVDKYLRLGSALQNPREIFYLAKEERGRLFSGLGGGYGFTLHIRRIVKIAKYVTRKASFGFLFTNLRKLVRNPKQLVLDMKNVVREG